MTTKSVFRIGSITLTVAGLALASLFDAMSPAMAVSTWDNSPATANFSTAGNWSSAPTFGTTCVLHFAASLSNSVYMGTAETVNQINFDATAPAYTIRLANTWSGTTPKNLTFDGTTPQINLASGSAAEVIGGAGGGVILNQSLTVNNSSANLLSINQGVTNGSASAAVTVTNASSGTGGFTISGILADGSSQKTAVVQNSATSQMALNAVNTFSGGLTIQSGVVRSTDASGQGFGAGTITMGNASGASVAVISTGRAPGNPFSLAAGATAAGSFMIISNNGTTTTPNYTGPISLNGNNLTICTGGSTPTTTTSGGITGSGNVTLDNESTGAGLIVVSGAAVNNSGAIVSENALLAGVTGSTTISAPVGANVTSITENYLSPSLTVSGMLTNNSGGTTLNSAGTALFKVSGGTTGTGNLTVNANSSGNFTLSGGAINHAGAFVNSGSGSGTVTVSAAIGANVSSVTQNSPSSALVLAGPSTYAGNTVLNTGTVQADYLETPGVSGPLGNQAANAAGTILLNGGTLQYSAANNADYSGRFSTAAGQAYNIDVNGQAVTYASGLNSSGAALNLVSTAAGGSLALSAVSAYNGSTTVNAGAKLVGVVGGSIANSAVTVNSYAATNSVLINNNTLSWTCGSLTFTDVGDLDFNFGAVAPSTTVPPLVVSGAAAFSATPTVTIEGVNILPGAYPLMTWGSTSGTVPSLVNMPPGSAATLGVVGSTLYLYVSTGTVVHKANNPVALSNPSSWVEGYVPVGVAAWDNTVTGPNTTVLGASMGWTVLQILNPGGLVTISADGNTLTNGSSIDMSAATADLTLDCNVDLGGNNAWNVTSGRTLTVNGVISDAYDLTKQGAGTLVYNGANTYTNLTDVSAGVLTIGAGGALTNYFLTVADMANTPAILNINGGTLFTTNNSVGLGKANLADGVINLMSGTLIMSNQLFCGNAGPGVAGFGALNISGGTAIVQNYVTAGRGASGTSQCRGEILVSGGTLTENANNLQIGSDSTAITNTSVMLLSGTGVVNLNSPAGLVIVGRVANGTLTVSNTAQLNVANASQIQIGQAAGVVGILNLNGGTVSASNIVQSAGTGYVNFNGGTLKAAKNTPALLAATAAYVYPGGAIIDDGGFVISNAQPLLAPTGGSGKGVSLAGMSFGGSGFVAPPIVDVVAAPGDPGVGASALATIDNNGNLTSVAIVNPGVNYVNPPTLMFTGGGGTVTPGGSVSLVANSASGGLTKNGVGSLTLSGVSTYAGPTVINAGILGFSGAASIASSPSIQINAGAELAGSSGISAASGAAVMMAAVTSTNSIIITNNTLYWPEASFIAAAAGVLDFNFGSVAPSTTVAPFQIAGAATFTATPTVTIEGNNITAGTYPLMTWGSSSGTAPSVVNLPAGVIGGLSVVGNTLDLMITTGNVLVKANNADNLNLTTSWITGVVPTGVAIWDDTVTAANATVLGADLNWAGLQIVNPGGTVTINNDGNVLTNGASGIDMSAATVNLNLNCNIVLSNAQTWTVAGGRTLTVNGAVSSWPATGVINKSGWGTLLMQGSVNYSNTEDVLNGTLIYNGAAVTSSARVIPDAAANSAARLVITNGASVISTSVNGNLRSGRAGALTGTNYVDLAGFYSLPDADAADGYAALYNACAYSEETFYPGGDFTARGVISYGGGSGTNCFRFNGGIIRAAQNNTTFITGITNVLVMAGGANIDDRGFAITIPEPLQNAGGGGGLAKIGGGTLTLSAVNTYTGKTAISNGVVALSGSGSVANSSGIQISSGAKLDVSGTTGTYALSAGQILVAGDTNATATIDGNLNLGSGSLVLNYTNGTPALMVTNGTLTFNGNAVTVNVAGAPLAAGSFLLASTALGGTVAGTLPSTVTVAGAGGPVGATNWLSHPGGQLYLNIAVNGLGGQVNSFGFLGSAFNLTFAGIPTYKYNVQVSTNLSYPNGWTTLWTTNAPAGGVFQFQDNTPPTPDAFYRLLWNGN